MHTILAVKRFLHTSSHSAAPVAWYFSVAIVSEPLSCASASAHIIVPVPMHIVLLLQGSQ